MKKRVNISRTSQHVIVFGAFFLIFLSLVSLIFYFGCAPAAFAEDVYADYEKIASWEDFETKVIDAVNSGDAEEYKFVLTASFSMPDGVEAVSSIGNSQRFKGIFDGNNHTISNYRTTGTGVFGFVSNALICNLRVEGKVSGSEAGGFVGKAFSNVRIYNCAFVGTVEGALSAGFIRTTAKDTKVINCMFDGTLAGASSVGFAYTINANAILKNCIANVACADGVAGCSGFSQGSSMTALDSCYSNQADGVIPTATVADWSAIVSTLNNNITTIGSQECELLQWQYKDGLSLKTTTIVTYSVTYRDDVGELLVDSVESGQHYATKGGDIASAKEGYSFGGWDSNGDGVKDVEPNASLDVAADIILIAVYDKIIVYHTVVHKVGDATVKTEEIESGSSITTLTATTDGVSQDGYELLGWDIDSDGTADVEPDESITITQDTTLIAVYRAIIVHYTVEYRRGDGESGYQPTDSNEYIAGSTVVVFGNVGGLAKDGWVFDGWDADGDSVVDYQEGDTFGITCNMVLVAVFAKVPIVEVHDTPSITSISKGQLDYIYDADMQPYEGLKVCVYNEQDSLVSSRLIIGTKCDLSDTLLSAGKGKYYATMVVVDTRTGVELSAVSARSDVVSVYAIQTIKVPGTTLSCPSAAFADTTVEVSAQLYTGYESLAIYLDGQAISGSFSMPAQDVVVSTSARMIVDYHAEISTLIASLSEEFSVDNYAIVKEIESIYDDMIEEQRAEVDMSRVEAVKAAYNQAVILAEQDLEDVNSMNIVATVVGTIAMASAVAYLALRGVV